MCWLSRTRGFWKFRGPQESSEISWKLTKHNRKMEEEKGQESNRKEINTAGESLTEVRAQMGSRTPLNSEKDSSMLILKNLHPHSICCFPTEVQAAGAGLKEYWPGLLDMWPWVKSLLPPVALHMSRIRHPLTPFRSVHELPLWKSPLRNSPRTPFSWVEKSLHNHVLRRAGLFQCPRKICAALKIL